MRIAIFGGTGRVGGEVLARALDAGWETTVLVRPDSRGKLPTAEYTIVEGDFLNADDVAKTIAGSEVVFSGVGGRGIDMDKPRTIMRTGAGHIVAAMQKHGVSRVVTVGTKGVLPTPDGDIYLNVSTPEILRYATADHYAAYEVLRESGLDYTVVAPPHMPEGDLGTYRLEREGFPADGGKATTADVADACWKILTGEGDFHRCRVGIAR